VRALAQSLVPAVLIADDDDDAREVFACSMQAAGWNVFQASDGLEAIEVAAAAGPHVIVMDVDMPTLDGLRALARLKRDTRTRHIPVVVCTGLDCVWAETRARAFGCERFVTKPCSPEDMLVILRDLIERRMRA
jgi:CheY-like chemotaxis protein